MSKFYYQDKPYKVPRVKYYDADLVAKAVERRSPCNCSTFLKDHSCEGDCFGCIFSCYNHEARLEYLKMKGILKMENNDTMPEIKGGMLVRNGSDWVLTANSSEGYVVTCDPYGAPTLSTGTSIYRDKISEVYYDKDFSSTKSLCVFDIKSIVSGTADLTQPSNENIAVWKRPDPIKEMTMADLEEHFGCKVKIVKDN